MKPMMRKALVAIVLAGVALGVAADAQAQLLTGDNLVFVSINGGFQAQSTDFTDNVVFTLFAENGDFETSHTVETGALFDLSGGMYLTSSLGVGVGVSRFSKTDDAIVTARLPHPFFFDRPREISGTASGLTREEVAVHVHAVWSMPVNDRIEAVFFGGPTFFNIKQDLVTEVTADEAFPFDTATFSSAAFSEQSESKTGFNVGADVAYYFSPSLGVGWLARFSRAKVDLVSEDGGTVKDVVVGGFHLAGGVRLRF